MVRGKTVIGPEIDPIAEIAVHITVIIVEEEEISIMVETMGPTIELEVSLEMVLEEMIDMIIDQTIEGTTLDRTKGIETEV